MSANLSQPAIAYYRVSTKQQGLTGYGLSDQQQQVLRFAASNGYVIIGEHTEVESGKNNKRPQLLEALAACKRNKATLIISKLDRLSRSVSFIAGMMDSKVDFKCVDMPEANTLMLHMMAAFAQFERELISSRTKVAIQVAIKKGKKWGTSMQKIADKNKAESMDHARLVAPIFLQLEAEGYITIRELCAELNKRDVPGPLDNAWNVASTLRYRRKCAQLA